MRPSLVRSILFGAVLLAAPVARGAAQGGAPQLSMTAGMTRLPLDGLWGGGLDAVSLDVTLAPRLSPTFSFALIGRAAVPTEGRSAMATCAGTSELCPSYFTPDAVVGGAFLAMLISPGGRVRLSAGGGYMGARGLRGSDDRSSYTLEAGAEWIVLPEWRMTPVLAMRAVRLTRRVAGMETILLPSIGIGF